MPAVANKTRKIRRLPNQKRRPVQVTFSVEFTPDSRKLTPADIERAAEMAAVVFRSTLENRDPAYDIDRFKVSWDYMYRQAGGTFEG